MNRTIITPPAIAPGALDELKQWLAITTARDDAALVALIRASLDACEGFTRTMPLEAECEEMLPATRGWQTLVTSPVQAITAVETVAPDGSRVPVEPVDYLLDIAADGCGRVNLMRPSGARIAVRFTAGLAPDWERLPDGLRHGVIRLAAHHYRERNDGGATRSPPAAVAALWQPWRRLRVA